MPDAQIQSEMSPRPEIRRFLNIRWRSWKMVLWGALFVLCFVLPIVAFLF